MIQILHYLKDPELWEKFGIFPIMGNAGFISSTVESILRSPGRNTPEGA